MYRTIEYPKAKNIVVHTKGALNELFNWVGPVVKPVYLPIVDVKRAVECGYDVYEIVEDVDGVSKLLKLDLDNVELDNRVKPEPPVEPTPDPEPPVEPPTEVQKNDTRKKHQNNQKRSRE